MLESKKPLHEDMSLLYMTICISKFRETTFFFFFSWKKIADLFPSYFDSIDRLFTPGWLPDNQDMLQARLRSTGITETLFELGQMNFRMMDVGGQRSERKKWIHCFEGVQCLLFMVALSGYDQCLVEDQSAVSTALF